MSLPKFIFINVLTWFLVVAETLIPIAPIRVGIGIPFLLFFPGYALLSALTIQSTQRLFLSVPLSMLVATLVGLGLNSTPWGINMVSVTYALALFTTFCLFIAVVRHRFASSNLDIHHPTSRVSESAWFSRPESAFNKTFFFFSIFIALGAMSAIIYFFNAPKTGEEFTQFTIASSAEGNTHFPNTLPINQAFTVYVSIFNHEGQTLNYAVELKKNGNTVDTWSDLVLADGQTRQEPLTFIFDSSGQDQKIEISLLINGQPYLSPLYLWFDVLDT
ncbi:DUF6541 family protein [Dehalogenimonas etheniformans]|uniref:DUF6541 family protein n=1 Tax=Dehalogenimonas etheniformans TaxID=1536648 RepID=UPI00167F2D43|nr:DUF1616 domain-containing protein [Dehalogenimonas etheniformans]QNT76156.1 DUF1616 domain-containing protein [Dehalogenimonas etheniformans]